MAKEMKEHSFFEKEDRCRRVFESAVQRYGGVWHLCTPGEKQPIIFKRPEDYAFAMTLVAMCAFDCPNNFVVDPGHTPFSYPYGANSCYFMPMIRERKHVLFGELTLREKRNLIHAREPSYPKDYIITDGYFSPVNYCHFDIGEAIFRDARHYFFLLGKNVESYRDIAEEIGDSIYYTDDELFDVLRRICKERYAGQRPTLLGKNEKLEMARMLHFDYNADNAKIARMLNFPQSALDQLFPSSK